MNPPTDSTATALQTAQRALDLLPSAIKSQLKLGKPKPGKAPYARNVNVPILAKVGGGLWGANKCYYEITVGSSHPAPGAGLNIGAVSFFCSVMQSTCGNGRYVIPLARIFEAAKTSRPGSFIIQPPEQAWFLFSNKYSVKVLSEFSVEHAARDMASLIEETFPKITAMLNAQ
jgi:hypothetical protein